MHTTLEMVDVERRPEELLRRNREWAKARLAEDPRYFVQSVKGQSPSFLWIGCADSRKPVAAITGTERGDLFVHRNVANLVVPTDMNLLSVLQYAVEVLKVPHVVVCGHYGCGGVQAALTNKDFGLINHWLRHIKDIYRIYGDELSALESEEQVFRRMVELNVAEQVRNLGRTSIVQRSWAERKGPVIHGWVYDIEHGTLQDQGIPLESAEQLEEKFRFQF